MKVRNTTVILFNYYFKDTKGCVSYLQLREVLPLVIVDNQ